MKGYPMPQLLTPEQAAGYLGLSKQMLAQLRYSGKGATFRKLGTKTVRYRAEDLDAWVDAAARTSTLDRKAA